MAHRSTLVGWSDGRIRRTRLLACVVAVCAIAVTWAMFLPWAGLTIGTSEPVCVTETETASIPMKASNGEVVDVQAFGCVSGYHSVQTPDPNDAPAYTSTYSGGALSLNPAAPTRDVSGQVAEQMQRSQALAAQAQLRGPHMAPVAEAKAGIPSETFYALAVAVLALLALLLRNAAPLIPVVVCTMFSFSAFNTHRSALMWGMEGFGAEMYGVRAHQWAFAALIAVVVTSAWLVLKANHEQRKIDGKRHPIVAALNTLASFVLRINADRIAEMAAKAAGKGEESETVVTAGGATKK